MEGSELHPDVRRRLHLAGVAKAWLKWPSKNRREFKAIIDVLDLDEEVVSVFDCFPGRWSFKGGLLFITDRRLVYLSLRFFRRRFISITFDSIRQARVRPFAGGLELVIETNSGKAHTFSRGLGGMKYFSPIFGELEKKLGDRVTGLDAVAAWLDDKRHQ